MLQWLYLVSFLGLKDIGITYSTVSIYITVACHKNKAKAKYNLVSHPGASFA